MILGAIYAALFSVLALLARAFGRRKDARDLLMLAATMGVVWLAYTIPADFPARVSALTWAALGAFYLTQGRQAPARWTLTILGEFNAILFMLPSVAWTHVGLTYKAGTWAGNAAALVMAALLMGPTIRGMVDRLGSVGRPADRSGRLADPVARLPGAGEGAS